MVSFVGLFKNFISWLWPKKRLTESWNSTVGMNNISKKNLTFWKKAQEKTHFWAIEHKNYTFSFFPVLLQGKPQSRENLSDQRDQEKRLIWLNGKKVCVRGGISYYFLWFFHTLLHFIPRAALTVQTCVTSWKTKTLRENQFCWQESGRAHGNWRIHRRYHEKDRKGKGDPLILCTNRHNYWSHNKLHVCRIESKKSNKGLKNWTAI